MSKREWHAYQAKDKFWSVRSENNERLAADLEKDCAFIMATAPDGLALAEMVMELGMIGFSHIRKDEFDSVLAFATALKLKAKGSN